MKLFIMLSIIRSAPSDAEKILRASSFTTGLLIFFGAEALGVPISLIIINSLTISHPFTFGLINVILPSSLGILVSWYFIRTLKRSSNIATRIMILVGTFTIFLFGNVYFQALRLEGFSFQKSLLPNLSFTIAIPLYAITKYDPEERDFWL